VDSSTPAYTLRADALPFSLRHQLTPPGDFHVKPRQRWKRRGPSCAPMLAPQSHAWDPVMHCVSKNFGKFVTIYEAGTCQARLFKFTSSFITY
jgi:hypothetical protein